MTTPVIQLPHRGRPITIGPTTNHILVGGSDSDGRVGVIEMALTPGFTGPPLHAHEQIEHVWYVLAGNVTAVIGDVNTVLSAGACAFVPRGVPHRFGNGGDDVARLLEIDTPRTLDAYFDELAEAMPAGAQVDPAIIAPILARHDTRIVA